MASLFSSLITAGYRIFGKSLENSTLARDFQVDLTHASIQMSAEEYLSASLLAAIIVPLFFIPIIVVIALALGMPATLAIIAFPFVWIFVGGLTFTAFYIYPMIKIEESKKTAKNSLPFATVYISTLAGAGMPVTRMIEILASFREYGEVATQAGGIMRDTEILGFGISTALERAAARTPSPELKELLWGINSTMTTGGDLRTFLMEKARGYMSSYKRMLDSYVEQLSLLTEVYITAVVVGSIFFIVMTTIMNMIGVAGSSLAVIQNLVVYLLLPLISIGFMILVSASSPV